MDVCDSYHKKAEIFSDEDVSLQLHLLLQDEFAFGIAWWEGERAAVTCPQR